ncbi:MAG: NAD(P)H-binding protein [Bacteriovoracaceae bacterium]|nr:NAD(P)H-binding protein [Bacteriovoracaceae bacterium]
MSRVFIAGASGFIGQALIQKLQEDESLSLVAMSRQKIASKHERLIWKQGDLFSLKDIAEALEGCDQAIYLVHSMLPSASLVQGTFYDLDLILADNFARACKLKKISHVVYLGGLMPEDQSQMSWHLKSRLEVEHCLEGCAPKITILRAGMVIGRGGSSFAILRRLIQRLPVMLCPSWTLTKAQPIDLEDLLSVIKCCMKDESVKGNIWDVGGPEVMTYQKMMSLMARSLSKSPRMISVGTFSLNMSRFWVTLVTGAPRALVYPLVLSLRYAMLVNQKRRFPRTELMQTTFNQSLEHWGKLSEGDVHAFHTPIVLRAPKHVRSVQRLILPKNKDALWVAEEYFKWLPQFFNFVIRIRIENQLCRFYLIHPKITLLLLEKSIERSSSDRQLLYIKGGLLAAEQGRGRLEFREVLDKKFVIAAIHDFRPALPWIIYKWTQAVVHLFVMNAFGRHLKEVKGS